MARGTAPSARPIRHEEKVITMTEPQETARGTIVIGVGTDLRGDSGFGGAVVEALRRQPGLAAWTRLARCEGEPARIVELWEGYRCALMVDAVRGGAERHGFLSRHDLLTAATASEQQYPDSARESASHPHPAVLRAAVRLGRTLDRLPDRIIVYAVHGRDFRPGAALSRPVELMVPELAGRISREILGVLSLGGGRPARPRPTP
jgi:hydrogenase maturation protease